METLSGIHPIFLQQPKRRTLSFKLDTSAPSAIGEIDISIKKNEVKQPCNLEHRQVGDKTLWSPVKAYIKQKR